MTLLESLRAQVVALLTERSTHETAKATVVAAVEKEERTELTADETATVTEARAAIADIDPRIAVLNERIAELEAEEVRDKAAAELRATLPGAGAPARVTNEERTYHAGNAHERSFFVDAFRQEFRSDPQAGDRIARHSRETIVENEKRATTTSSFAGLVVPQYLVDQAALLARAGRPIANRVNRLPLPDQGTTFQVPRGTTGAAVAAQNGENTGVQSTDEVWTNLTITMSTIAGQQDISRQSLERGTPGIDQIVYMDLAGAYAAELDRQVVNGAGASGEMPGIIGTSGINAATAFGGAVSATNFWLKVAGQVQAIAANRFLGATSIYMHPRRWGWLLAQVDTTGRPLVVPVQGGNVPNNAQGAGDGAGYAEVMGYLQGLPVVTDANIPTNVGAATGGEDIVLVCRDSDLLLWEDGDGAPRELRFEQTLGNQLTVKLVVYGYAAFAAGRYPKAVGKIGGLDTTTNGLVNPTF